MVSIASRRVSSWPVVIGKVRQSTMMSPTCMPQFLVRSSISRVATCTFQLGGAGLALLVDGERDHGGAVLLHQRHDPRHPRLRAVTVLVVDRVDDGAAAEQFQACRDHFGLGRVEHQWQRRRGREPPCDLAHVSGAVPADVVDAQVEQVGAVSRLLPGDLHAVVVPAVVHRLAEGLRAVGIGALADGEERGFLPERHVLVERCGARLGPRAPALHLAAAHPRDDRRQVLGRRAAAAAHQGDAELGDEPIVRGGQLAGAERVARAVGGQFGQARRSAGRTAPPASAARGTSGARSSRTVRWRS